MVKDKKILIEEKGKIYKRKIRNLDGYAKKWMYNWRSWVYRKKQKKQLVRRTAELKKVRLPTEKVKRVAEKGIKRGVKREIGRKVLKARLERPVYKPKVKRITAIRRKRPRKIEGAFKRAVSKVVIADILPIATSQINNEYKRLFGGIIRDKDILDIMITEENIQKIKHRFEIRANIYGLRGEKLAEISKGEGGSLMELKSLMEGKIWKGELLDYPEDPRSPVIGGGYTYTFLQKGNVDRVETIVVFRS